MRIPSWGPGVADERHPTMAGIHQRVTSGWWAASDHGGYPPAAGGRHPTMAGIPLRAESHPTFGPLEIRFAKTLSGRLWHQLVARRIRYWRLEGVRRKVCPQGCFSWLFSENAAQWAFFFGTPSGYGRKERKAESEHQPPVGHPLQNTARSFVFLQRASICSPAASRIEERLEGGAPSFWRWDPQQGTQPPFITRLCLWFARKYCNIAKWVPNIRLSITTKL